MKRSCGTVDIIGGLEQSFTKLQTLMKRTFGVSIFAAIQKRSLDIN